MLSPLCATKWNYATAAHLLNRAGFGGTPGEIEELIALGPDKAVDKLVDYEKIPDPASDPEWARPDPTRAGEGHPVTQIAKNEQDSVKRWDELPDLVSVNSVHQLKPGATTLLRGLDENRREAIVLAYQRYGRGKAMVFNG